MQKEEPTSEKQEINQDEKELYAYMQTAGEFLQAYQEAEDKAEFLKNKGSTYISAKTGELIKNVLKAYGGVNAELSLNFDGKRVKPQGKALIPLTPNNPNHAVFVQTGLTAANQDRQIVHLGLGHRIYPQAKSFEDLGKYMIGYNAFYDYDLARNHQRGSVGIEFMNDDFKISSNAYRAISGWKDSPDFDKGYAEERAASGIDINGQVYLTKKISLSGGIAKWLGDDVAVFGDTDNLEKNPKIWNAALEYSPVPAISIKAKHEQSLRGTKNDTVTLGFNMPVGGREALHNAFNPDAVNMASGRDLKSSRSMFVERDYSMPLKYRSKPGKYHITSCGQPGDNKYCFLVKDGLNKLAVGVPTRVVPDDKCVIFDNNGNYLTNVGGIFVATVTESCTPKTTVTVSAGTSNERFEIQIQKLSVALSVEPNTIERWQSSNLQLTLKSSSGNIYNLPISWKLEGPGTLEDVSNTFTNNLASAKYVPDPTITHDYQIVVTAIVNGVEYRAPITIKFYGANAGDFIVENNDGIEGTEVIKIIYKNLRASSTVTFTSSGNGKLSATSTASSLSDSLELTVNDQGEAVCWVKADDVDSGSIHVEAKTLDPYFVASADIAVKSYVPSVSAPTNLVDPGESFDITVSGLKPNSTIRFNNVEHATLTSSESVTVPASGTVTATYSTENDYFGTSIDGLKANYYRNVDNNAVDLDLGSVALKTYTLSISSDTDSIIASGTANVTVSGGRPGEGVAWSISGSGKIASSQNTFDSNGKATATVQGQTPYTGTIYLTASTMEKNINTQINIKTFPSERYTVFDCRGNTGSGCKLNHTFNIDNYSKHKEDAKKVTFYVDLENTGDLYVDGTYISHESDPNGGYLKHSATVTSSKRSWYLEDRNTPTTCALFNCTEHHVYSVDIEISY